MLGQRGVGKRSRGHGTWFHVDLPEGPVIERVWVKSPCPKPVMEHLVGRNWGKQSMVGPIEIAVQVLGKQSG